MKIRPKCVKHQVDLRNFEESNLLFSRSGEPGVWELDLSDFECPMERTIKDDGRGGWMDIPETDPEYDECSWSWIAELIHYSAVVGEDPYKDPKYQEALAKGLDDASGE